MMRVLLYEPMLHGHRGVLLKYYCGALTKAGWETEVCTEQLPEHESPLLADVLERRAAKVNCQVIHVLTFERLGPLWLKYPRPVRRGRPIVASYYLYDNLYKPFKGLMWDLLFRRGLVDRVLISDDFLAERMIPGWRRRRLNYVPDPWDPAEFPPVTRLAARIRLGLPADRKILLLFGAIKPRKGLELLLEAMQQLGDRVEDYLLLIAGKMEDSLKAGQTGAILARLQEAGRIRMDDGFVAEQLVSSYFYAADYVVCPYPSTFQGSSNVFTRACAAGTPAIVPEHGVMGEIARRHGAGLRFVSDSSRDLARVLQEAMELGSGTKYQGIVSAGIRVADGKKLVCFERSVALAYKNIQP